MHLSRIWKLTRFTRFIRKVFATKILLFGKFLLFVTLHLRIIFYIRCTFFQRWSDLFSHSSEETLCLQSWVAIVEIWICEGSYLRACSRKEIQMVWQHGFHGSKTFRWDSHLTLRSPIWSASSFVKVLQRARSHGHQGKMLNDQLYIGIPFNIIKLKGLDCDKRTQWKCFISWF